MSQRCERLDDNAILPTKFEQIPLGEIRMDSTCTTAGLIRAAATISRSFSKLTSDKPIDLHFPSSTRRSSARHVSTNVTPKS